MKIEIKNIIIPEGHRPLDQAKVAEIANSIKMIGLLHAIGVSLKNGVATLVFGAHRLEASRARDDREARPRRIYARSRA